MTQAFLALAVIGWVTHTGHAEEGGSGHYMPGATASFIDALPGRQSFVYVNAFTYYNGSAGAARPLQFGGQIATNIDATVFADTSKAC